MFLLFLFDLEGWILCLLTQKKWDQNQVVHSQKLFLWVKLFFKFLKIILRRGKRPQGVREKVIWGWSNFYKKTKSKHEC